MDSLISVNDSNFEEVVKSSRFVMVDFNATWCSPCKAVGEYLNFLKPTYEDKIIFASCNIEENADDLVSKFGIRSVPTLIYFENGAEVRRDVGSTSLSQLADNIDGVLRK